MNQQLTDRQREILAVVVQITDIRRVAETLDMAYVTLKNHLDDIKERLNLEDHFVEFGSVAIDGHFVHKGKRYQRVDHATDRLGGYNAQDGDGRRKLFQYCDVVERIRE